VPGGGGGGGGDRLAQSALEGKLLLALQEQQRLKEERRKATADKAELRLQFDALLDEKQQLERAQLTSEHERLKVAKAIVDLQVLLPPHPPNTAGLSAPGPSSIHVVSPPPVAIVDVQVEDTAVKSDYERRIAELQTEVAGAQRARQELQVPLSTPPSPFGCFCACL